MLTQKNAVKILQREIPYLKKSFGVKKISLFGSFTKNRQDKDSDIDMLVEFEKPIGLKFMDLAEYLERALGKKTDILTAAGIKGIRVKRIAKDITRSLSRV